MSRKPSKTSQELIDELKAEEQRLRDAYAEKVKKAKEREKEQAVRLAKKKRPLENRGKFLLAGWILAEAKKSKKVDMLHKCMDSMKESRDKEAIQALIDLVK